VLRLGPHDEGGYAGILETLAEVEVAEPPPDDQELTRPRSLVTLDSPDGLETGLVFTEELADAS
jgi:hypothetical protein